MAKAKATTSSTNFVKKVPKNRKWQGAKTDSKSKTSKNYKKPYRGQGR
jgi:hypothetical protein